MRKLITLTLGMLIACCAIAAVPKDFVKEKKEIIKTELVVPVVITNVVDVWNYDVSPGNYSCDIVIDESNSLTEADENTKHNTFLRKLRQERGIRFHKKIYTPPIKR